MHYSGLFKKSLSIKKGEMLLAEYCSVNGFEDNMTQWKEPTHSKHLFPYKIISHKAISRNRVSFHRIRQNNKYTIWIDLVTEEIGEILR